MWGASKDFEFIPKISQTAPLWTVKNFISKLRNFGKKLKMLSYMEFNSLH
jgi:hypothetical protein